MTETRPGLFAIPSADGAFAAIAEATLVDGQSPEEFRSSFARRTRGRWFGLGACPTRLTVVWYAYREGRWVAG